MNNIKILFENEPVAIKDVTAEQRERIIAALAEKPKGFPQVGDKYEVLTAVGRCNFTWIGDGIDLARLACGNVHPVGRGEYLHRRRIAVKALWDYVEREMPFVPDWDNSSQSKYYACYEHSYREMRMCMTWTTKTQFEFPWVANSDATRFLTENADNLAVIAEGVDKWGM